MDNGPFALFITFPGMDKIPVQFEYEGISFEGYFRKVSGAASGGLYQLIINDKYFGQLWKTETYGWRFGSNSGMFEEKYMVDYFASVVEE